MKAFLKKEIKEILKTYRIWAIPVIFLFLGFSAPATTKFLPEIMTPQLKAQGITITMPKPDAIAAYQAYFKNLAQMGLLAVILFTMSLVSEEKARGILAQVVTKPVGRPAIVTAKWLVHGAWLLISMIVGAAGCYLYTLGLFEKASFQVFAYANLVFAFYLLFIFSLTLAASTVLRSQVAAAGVSLGGFFAVSLLVLFNDTLARYSPPALNDVAVKIISGDAHLIDAVWPILTTIIFAGLLLAGGIYLFDRQEL